MVVSLREFRKFGLDQILDWVTAKRKAFYFEPSSRFDTQGLHEKRGLFYLPSADFRVKDRDLLTETLFLMNAPARFRENIFRFLPAAQGIHFGFDQRELDQSQASLICKCYLEFSRFLCGNNLPDDAVFGIQMVAPGFRQSRSKQISPKLVMVMLTKRLPLGKAR